MSPSDYDKHAKEVQQMVEADIAKEEAEKRKEAERNLKLAVEVTQVVLWKIDLLSGTLVFDLANLAFLGVDADESLTSLQGWLERVHPDDAGPFMERFQFAMQPGDPVFDLEYRFRRRDGQYLWIHTKGSVIQRGADGRPEIAVGTSMNITARKQIEQAAQDCEARGERVSNVTYTKGYLQAFEKNAAATKTSAELIDAMKKAYPAAPMGLSLDIGAKVSKGEMKW